VPERTDLNRNGEGVRFTRDVLRALPPQSREDEATVPIIKGMLWPLS
jgi:hypothetical protein